MDDWIRKSRIGIRAGRERKEGAERFDHGLRLGVCVQGAAVSSCLVACCLPKATPLYVAVVRKIQGGVELSRVGCTFGERGGRESERDPIPIRALFKYFQERTAGSCIWQ